MIVGGYVLHLYCENASEHDYTDPTLGEYGGGNKSEAYKEAKLDGWFIDDKKGIAICGKCRLNNRKIRGISAPTDCGLKTGAK